MRPHVSWADLRSGARRASGASASRAGPPCAGLRALGVEPAVVVDDRASPAEPVEGVTGPAPTHASGAGGAGRLRVRRQEPGHQPARPRRRERGGQRRCPAGRRPRPLAGGSGRQRGSPASPGRRARAPRRPWPARWPRGSGTRCFVGGNLGLPAVRPRRADRRRPLDRRDVELPGRRPQPVARGGGGDLAGRGPPRLARRPRHLRGRQALALLAARRARHGGQRRRRPARASAADQLGPEVVWVSPARRGPRLGRRAWAWSAGTTSATRSSPSGRSWSWACRAPTTTAALAEAAAGFAGPRAPAAAARRGRPACGSSTTAWPPTSSRPSPRSTAFAGERVALLVGGHRPRGGLRAAGRGRRRVRGRAAGAHDARQRRPDRRCARGRRAVEVRPAPDLEAAVAEAFAWARPDGVVLLSPAAPSFGRFRDYRDRSEAFRRAMEACRE